CLSTKMSKALNSPVRSRSRSKSRSRSYSRSHSRSRSRSRSRKRHYRSRSRSKSHTPPYRNYPSRDNRGGFRGYNRGYRRPYHYRGRNRGYYARGHYQNWHDRQDHRSHSPRRGRSRTPKKRSGSRSRSRYSDRSSSAKSRQSRRSSYSSHSRSSSPRHRSSKGKLDSKDAKAGGGQPEKSGPAEGSVIEKASGGKWIDYDASPKQGSPDDKKEGASSDPDSKGATGGTLWKSVGRGSPPEKSPSKSGESGNYGGFGFFSKEDAKDGDKNVISAAFKNKNVAGCCPLANGMRWWGFRKYLYCPVVVAALSALFLVENKSKKSGEKESSSSKERSSVEKDKEKGGKSGDSFNASFSDFKEDKVLPFFEAGEEEFLKSHGLKEHKLDDEGDPKATLSSRDIFGKWGDEPKYSTSYPSFKEKSRRDVDEEDSLEHMEEELYRSRKHSQEESISCSNVQGEGAPAVPSTAHPSSAHHLSSTREEFELKITSLEDLPRFGNHLSASHDQFLLAPPLRNAGKIEFDHESLDLLQPRSANSDQTSSLSRDLLSNKDPEIRSIFQLVQAAQLRRSPSELFAQHIVSVLHYIKAQHFQSSEMTLSERFAMYQRKAAEAEIRKPRKSPEIHRRIDVSPSAFKRHAQLFDDMEEAGYKDPSQRFKGDVMDLRLDIERRKRFAGREREDKRSPAGSRGPSRDRSSEKSGKRHKKSKKAKRKRDRSRKEYMGEGMDHSEEGFTFTRYPPQEYSGPPDRGPRDYEGYNPERGRGRGFFPRVRGRGWNRGNYPGNNSNGNPANMNPVVRPPEEEWDPEYTPKSRKYYLHDDRDGEKSWVDNRGRGRGSFPARRGRFVYRKGGSSPKWTHDMFQGGDDGGLGDENIDLDRKEAKNADDGSSL
uniref:Thyroid hormone receptor associated protein 3b n=1 Tax=Tetraodon nigroviridis TaxID=99883 RepID=H3CG54_TETNG